MLPILVALAVGVLAAPLGVGAQPASKVARVGILSLGVTLPPVEAAKSPFVTALRDLGWAGGQNIIFEVRDAAGQTDRRSASRAGGRPGLAQG
jgi:hypothetical protein